MPNSFEQGQIAKAIEAERYQWRLHVLMRMADRGILQQDVLKVIADGERIEDYPHDSPHPSALFLGKNKDGEPLHVVAAYDMVEDWAYIITAYIPDLLHFEPDWKTRRKS